MKKILISLLVVFCSFLLIGCEANNKTFSLDEEYYKSSEFIELGINEFNDLVNNNKSFAIFIYQPLCSASYNFNKVLTEFANQYQIKFYKMSFADMRETELNEHIKYYPSLVIYHNGELVDYLDANSDSHSGYYKSVDGFTNWFSSYITIKKSNVNNNSSLENDINSDMKIDAKLENVKYYEDKVNIYFFWGNGCPHCEEEFRFLESIETEYGDYFILNTFEVWHNEENQELLKQFANAMGDEVSGVPYTIIGNRTFTGFSEKFEEQFLEIIKEQHKNSYDVYFNKEK